MLTRNELFEFLEGILTGGYALESEERAIGVQCIAAPVITNDDTVSGAISVVGPAS